VGDTPFSSKLSIATQYPFPTVSARSSGIGVGPLLQRVRPGAAAMINKRALRPLLSRLIGLTFGR